MQGVGLIDIKKNKKTKCGGAKWENEKKLRKKVSAQIEIRPEIKYPAYKASRNKVKETGSSSLNFGVRSSSGLWCGVGIEY